MPKTFYKSGWLLFSTLVFAFLISACSSGNEPVVTLSPTLEPTKTLPPPGIHSTPAPDVKSVASAYLNAWQSGDYESMYGLLTAESQSLMDLETFSRQHRDLAFQVTLESLEYELGDAVVTPTQAELPYQVVLHTSLVGDISSNNQMSLAKEGGDWKIVWSPGLILQQLVDGSTLRMDLEVPIRRMVRPVT